MLLWVTSLWSFWPPLVARQWTHTPIHTCCYRQSESHKCTQCKYSSQVMPPESPLYNLAFFDFLHTIWAKPTAKRMSQCALQLKTIFGSIAPTIPAEKPKSKKKEAAAYNGNSFSISVIVKVAPRLSTKGCNCTPRPHCLCDPWGTVSFPSHTHYVHTTFYSQNEPPSGIETQV